MNYIINLLRSLKEIIIVYIIEYLILIASCIIYSILGNKNINYFIYNCYPYISIAANILIIIYLHKKNKIKIIKNNKQNYLIYISLGISISCILNMIIYSIKKESISNIQISPIILLISSGIIGPILEEMLFRYINYNKLKKFNSISKTIIINSIIFSLIHIQIEKILFALPLGLILSITYEKRKNIIIPIIIHISANSIALLLNTYSPIILSLAIILLIITIIDFNYGYKC